MREFNIRRAISSTVGPSYRDRRSLEDDERSGRLDEESDGHASTIVANGSSSSNGTLPVKSTKSSRIFDISRPINYYDFVQLRDEEDTLFHKLRSSPGLFSSVEPFQSSSADVALFCYSIIANKMVGSSLIPGPADLAVCPFVVRWRCPNCLMDGVYCCLTSTRMTTSLRLASTLSYARMFDKMACKGHECTASDEETSYRQCEVGVGSLTTFREATIWHDFAPQEDFIFVEVKGRDGLWRSAYKPPAKIRGTKAEKKRHILKAFRSCGFTDLFEDVRNFWKSICVTKCRVTWQTASWSDYALVANENEDKTTRAAAAVRWSTPGESELPQRTPRVAFALSGNRMHEIESSSYSSADRRRSGEDD